MYNSKESFLYYMYVSCFTSNRVVDTASYSGGSEFESGSLISFSGRGFSGFLKSSCAGDKILPIISPRFLASDSLPVYC